MGRALVVLLRNFLIITSLLFLALCSSSYKENNSITSVIHLNKITKYFHMEVNSKFTMEVK